MKVVGDFTVNDNFYVSNAVIKVSAGKKILLTSPSYWSAMFFQLNNTKIFACGSLWKGIEMGFLTAVEMTNCRVEDAEIAINATDAAFASIYSDGNIFDRNKIGLKLETINNGWYVVTPWISYLHNTKFWSTSTLNDGSARGDVGIKIKNVAYPLAYNYGNSNNYFNNLKKGVLIDGSYSVYDVNDYTFEKITESCIDFLGGDILNVVNSTFLNPTDYSVNFSNSRSLDIHSSTFSYSAGGVYTGLYKNNISVSNPTANNSINIYNNYFDIYGYFGEIAYDFININTTIASINAYIRQNYFESANSSNSGSVQAINLKGNMTSNGSVLIENNDFNNSNCGAVLNRNISITNGSKNNVKVIANRCLTGAGTFLGFLGFNGSTGMGNEISDNNIDKVAFTPINPFSFGGQFIVLGSVQNTKICSNIDNAGSVRAFRFGGDNLGTNLIANTTYGNFFESVYIGSSSTVIGTQMHKGNRWFPYNCNNSNTICHPKIVHADPNIAYLSLFTVHTNKSVLNTNTGQYSFFSEYFPFDITPNITSFFFKDPNGGSPATACVTQLMRATQDPIVDPLIAKNGLADYLKTPVRQFDAQMQLYRKMKFNPDEYRRNSGYFNFLQMHESKNVGKNFAIEQLIDVSEKIDESIIGKINTLKLQLKAIELDAKSYSLKNQPSKEILEKNFLKRGELIKNIDELYKEHAQIRTKKLVEAKKIIDNFNATLPYERLIKDVYQIYLEANINQKGVFTEEQVERLKKVAMTCYDDGGMIVYVARGFLSQDDLLEVKKAVAECESESDDLISAKDGYNNNLVELNKKNITKSNFAIYPNPSKNSFNISIDSNEGTAYITDVNGRIINSYILKNGENNIQHNLTRGIYIVNVKTIDGISTIKKLTVQD